MKILNYRDNNDVVHSVPYRHFSFMRYENTLVPEYIDLNGNKHFLNWDYIREFYVQEDEE